MGEHVRRRRKAERSTSSFRARLPVRSRVTKQDDFVGRMLWALSDPGGLPAKRFAEMNPVPSLDWLEPFSENASGETGWRSST